MKVSRLMVLRQLAFYALGQTEPDVSTENIPSEITEYHLRERRRRDLSIHALTARQFDTLWLFGRYGISPATIAAHWGIPVENVIQKISQTLLRIYQGGRP